MLLERESLLAQLRAQWDGACGGPGRLVFVEGEAGIGKTSLLRELAQMLEPEARVLWGACEAMRTPRPLGALDDIARQAGGTLAQRLSEPGDRQRLFVAFVDTLAERPTLAVIEDLHWADDATLDLLRYAGRRVRRTRSLLAATFRSDELVPAHPLRAVLGDLATGGALRLAPAPLSLDAVRTLCRGQALEAEALHRETAGNPFFVTEVLAAGARGAAVPASVADAVLARAARLSPAARAVLDAAAVVGPRIDPLLLQEVAAGNGAAVDECLGTGVLCADGGDYAFRHELARQAVLQALTPARATELHRRALRALQSQAAQPASMARLAQHAEGAADGAAVRQWATCAAEQAAARGAHRQAAAQWERALRFTPHGAERAALLDRAAVAVHMSVNLERAIALRREAAALWRMHGEPGRAALSLAEAAELLMLGGRRPEAEQALAEAGRLPLATGSPAALALQGSRAWLHAHDGDDEAAIALARPVLAAAEQRGDRAAMVVSLNTIGSALLTSGRVDEGLDHLERTLTLAAELNDDRLVAQVYANLGAGCVSMLRLAQAETYLGRGIEFCAERDLDAPRLHQRASWSNLCRLLGRWDEAAAAAEEVLADARATVVARVAALIALGRLGARRGDAGVWERLDEARAMARNAGDNLRLASARARAEAAWLEGRPEAAAQEVGQALPPRLAERQPAVAAEVLLWRRLGGILDPVPDACADHPFALEAVGRWSEAAQAWRALGCPFETARALSQGDEAALRQTLSICEALGARPLAERVRQRLRARGARGLPRGPRRSTQAHPAGLTNAEIEVLGLLAAGLRNKEIAQRLHRSPRTVDHHLQAVFAKLGVATRAEAVGAAFRLKLVPGGEPGTPTG